MTNIVLMLGLLVSPCVGLLVAGRRPAQHRTAFQTAGCVGVALVFAFTAIGHFALTRQMAEMIPPFVRQRHELVLLSGAVELAAAVTILIPQLRRVTGALLIAMLILFLPINIYSAIMYVPFGGHEMGPAYLLVRIPLQAVLIAWIWLFAIPPRVARPSRIAKGMASAAQPTDDSVHR